MKSQIKLKISYSTCNSRKFWNKAGRKREEGKIHRLIDHLSISLALMLQLLIEMDHIICRSSIGNQTTLCTSLYYHWIFTVSYIIRPKFYWPKNGLWPSNLKTFSQYYCFFYYYQRYCNYLQRYILVFLLFLATTAKSHPLSRPATVRIFFFCSKICSFRQIVLWILLEVDFSKGLFFNFNIAKKLVFFLLKGRSTINNHCTSILAVFIRNLAFLWKFLKKCIDENILLVVI